MRKFLATLSLLTLIPLSSAAWSYLGHATVVKLAEKHLTEKTRKNLAAYFNYDLADDAVWMDKHRHDEDIAVTDKWHVFHAFESGLYDPNPRMVTGDCVRALHFVDANLRNYKELSDSAVVMNVRMLIHFVGDLHCPSHAYFQGKRNFWACRLEPYWSEGTFHGFYDHSPEFVYKDKTPEDVAEILDYNLGRTELSAASKGSFEEWASERAAADKFIYELNAPGTHALDQQTLWKSVPLINDSMTKAGCRLAFLLNKYFGK